MNDFTLTIRLGSVFLFIDAVLISWWVIIPLIKTYLKVKQN
jgi:hypothetical protein